MFLKHPDIARRWEAEGKAYVKKGVKSMNILKKAKKQANKLKRKWRGAIKHTGTFNGKSNRLGQGGRAAQMRARGVPEGVIGAIARREQAAPGQKNYHKKTSHKKHGKAR